jgi:hypothetical protein
MKTRTLLTILFTCSVVFSIAQNIAPAPADKAVIYFVRPSSLGLAINFSYFDSTRLVGRFNGPNYIRYECEPGKHLFWARSENRDFVEAEIQPGKIYFIEAIVKMGAVKAAVNLEPINPNDPDRMKKIIKLLDKKTSQSFTSEELAAEEISLQDVIDRGLEKYNSDKEKGKSFPQLAKNMFYGN